MAARAPRLVRQAGSRLAARHRSAGYGGVTEQSINQRRCARHRGSRQAAVGRAPPCECSRSIEPRGKDPWAGGMVETVFLCSTFTLIYLLFHSSAGGYRGDPSRICPAFWLHCELRSGRWRGYLSVVTTRAGCATTRTSDKGQEAHSILYVQYGFILLISLTVSLSEASTGSALFAHSSA